MIALPNHSFGCPHCKVELRLRHGAELSSGPCPSCNGWLHAPRKMAMSSPTSQVKVNPENSLNTSVVSFGDRAVHEIFQAKAETGSFNALNMRVENGNVLPARRAGVPPRLLGDHPAQIAQTLIPQNAQLPKNDAIERKREVRAARRWDNAKMVALSFIVFGMVGGMIQWTRMGGGAWSNKVAEPLEPKVETTQTKPDKQVKPGEQEPQVASYDETSFGDWHEQ